MATKQVYEALLDVDSNLAIVPQLAVAWRVAGLTHWDFELRRNARFHDGSPFTAEDVVFSIERARAETSDFRSYVQGIAAVEVIDDHTVRITTTEPDPSLWLKLAEIAIISKAWAQEHGVVEPADYQKAHEETYASRHATGTGPFMVEAFEAGGDYVLVRNSDWWGATEYPHNIDRIVHTRKEANAEKLAALLAGEIDLLQTPPYSALDQIRGTPGLKLTHRPKLLTQWLGLDQGSTELRSSNVKGRNPFKDKRVRQAMAHAIDIEPILRPLMHEMFAPAGMVVAPGVNGYAPDLDQPVPYELDKARALLTEAGYPDGFSVILDCPNDWGDDEIATCDGVADQLGKIAIKVVVNFLPTGEWETKVLNDRRSDFHLDDNNGAMDLDSEKLLRIGSIARVA